MDSKRWLAPCPDSNTLWSRGQNSQIHYKLNWNFEIPFQITRTEKMIMFGGIWKNEQRCRGISNSWPSAICPRKCSCGPLTVVHLEVLIYSVWLIHFWLCSYVWVAFLIFHHTHYSMLSGDAGWKQTAPPIQPPDHERNMTDRLWRICAYVIF